LGPWASGKRRLQEWGLLLALVDGAGENNGLDDNLGVDDKRTAVNRRSNGGEAEENRSKDGRGLHVGVGCVCCVKRK